MKFADLSSSIMIGKIDSRMVTDFKSLSTSPTSKAPEDPHFKSLLQERLADPKPLELMMVQLLSRTIELFLSRATAEEDDLFISPPFLLKPPVPLSQENQQPSGQPSVLQYVPSAGIPGVQEVSKNLHERRDHDYDDIIADASRRYGVEPALVKAVIAIESGGNPNALSPAGAQGLMQLMPRTAGELGVMNPFDPVENIMAGTRYLRQLLDRYWGDVRLALAAYNWGMGNLEKRPDAMPKETKNYIIKVEHLYRTHLSASL